MIFLQKKIRRFFIILSILFYFIPSYQSVHAAVDVSKGPVTIEADSIAYDQEDDTYHAKGDVLIEFSGGFLMAESVTLNRISNEALAEGYALMMSDDDILEGDVVRFNVETKTGIVYDGKMFLAKNHFYVKGLNIEKTGEATYHVVDATATSCDGDSPDWRLRGSELDVTIDGYGTLKHGRFLAKDVPILYSPYFLFPAKTTRQSGFLFPYLSYSQKSGLDIELPFFWAISENTDATFYQRYIEQKGFKEGIEFRYFLSKDSFGTIYGDFLNDTSHNQDTTDGGGIRRDWQTDQKRWSFYLNHETIFDPSLSFRTDIRKVSDVWYFRDFSSHNYYLENYSTTETQKFSKVPFIGDESLGSLDSTVRLTKNWQLYNMTALVRYIDDFSSTSNDATLQRYPEITLTGIKRPIFGTPLNLEFTSIYDYFYRNEGQKGHLFDIQPTLSLPIRFGDYLQLTPQVSVKETYWYRDDGMDLPYSKDGKRDLYNLGATATTEIHRIFTIGGRRLDKIRHGIKPELTYSYIPNIYQDDIPNFASAIPEQNTLTYALTNTFIAKFKEKGGKSSYLEFLRFKLSQTYDLKEARRGDVFDPTTGVLVSPRPFSDIAVELDFMPFRYFSFLARNSYSVYSRSRTQSNYDVNVSDQRGDVATLGYRYAQSVPNGINPLGSVTPFSSFRYSQSALEETNLSLKAVVTQSFDFISILRRNELDNKTLEKTFGFNYHKQCWNVEMRYSESQDAMGVNDAKYTVTFFFYGLGKIGSK